MEVHHDITIEEIYIPSKHTKDDYLCEDFVIYPDGKEKTGGFVLGILEIRATPLAESEKIIKIIVNTLKEKYYGQINTSPDPQKLNLETVFEYALQKTNEALMEMIQIGHISFSLENLNYVVAVAKPNEHTKDIEFFFTNQGLVNAYLLHKTRQNNYKVINIVDNTSRRGEDDTNRIKFFSSTLSGKIFYHDAIFLCSEIFGNFIPPHKVNKILSTNDLTTAIDYFKNIINNVRNNSHLTYSAIFIKMEEKRAIIDSPISQKSINQLISTTERTEKYLTPTFALDIKGNFAKLLRLFKKEPGTKHLQGPALDNKSRFGLIKYIFNLLILAGIAIFGALTKVWRIITGKEKLSLKEAFTRPKDKLLSLPRVNKSILVVGLILVIIFISSIFWIRYRQATGKIEAVYATELQQIKDKINNAQVNLIYKNEDQSLTLAKQAETDLGKLPQTTNNQKANYAELLSQINTLKNKLLHIEKVVPQLITEIVNNGQPQNLSGLSILGTDLIVFGNGNAIYKIDKAKKQINKTFTSDAGDIVAGAGEDDNVILLTNQNKLLRLKADAPTPLSIDWAENDLLFNSFRVYNNNIYVISNTKNQIIKYIGNDSGFSGKTDWVKDRQSANLTEAISLAIDSNIYTLSKAGVVNKFFGGKYQNFTLSQIDPIFSNASKIFTDQNQKNIYILEDKRIVVYTKDGKLVNQYVFDTLAAPITDFSVSEKDNKIYFISENKIYEANLK